MCNIAFDIAGAALASAVSERTLIKAIKGKRLLSRRVEDKAVILRTDIQSWLESQPDFLAAD